MSIPKEQLEVLLTRILSFPYGSICKHHVCLDIISMGLDNGMSFDNELVKAVSNADDETALKLLEKQG